MVRFFSSPPSSEGPDRAVDRAAGRWVARLSSREISPRDLGRFERWLSKDPQHRAAFDRLRATWLDLGHLDPWDGSAARFRTARRAPLRRAAPVAAAVLAAVGTAAMAAENWTRWTSDASTGEAVRTLRLSDGSLAVLDAGSAIDVNYSPDTRRIVLKEGRVWVSARPHPARPFIIEAQGLSVRAQGDDYAVAKTAAGPELTVTSGIVAAAGPGDLEAVLVNAGTSRRYVDGQPQEAVARDASTAWRSGRLIIEGQDLAGALAQIDRYRPGRIVPVDLPADRTVNAAFFLRDLETGLEGLAAAQGLRLHRLGPVTIVTVDDRQWRPSARLGQE